MQTNGKVLLTPRLILRPFEDRDAEAMFAIMSDDESTWWLFPLAKLFVRPATKS